MASYIPELKADNSENFPQKLTDSKITNTPEVVYGYKHHAIDSDDCQTLNENSADVPDIHF